MLKTILGIIYEIIELIKIAIKHKFDDKKEYKPVSVKIDNYFKGNTFNIQMADKKVIEITNSIINNNNNLYSKNKIWFIGARVVGLVGYKTTTSDNNNVFSQDDLINICLRVFIYNRKDTPEKIRIEWILVDTENHYKIIMLKNNSQLTLNDGKNDYIEEIIAPNSKLQREYYETTPNIFKNLKRKNYKMQVIMNNKIVVYSNIIII